MTVKILDLRVYVRVSEIVLFHEYGRKQEFHDVYGVLRERSCLDVHC